MSRSTDEVGNVYGQLTVVKELCPILDNSGSNRRIMEVLCSCGNVVSKKLKYLKNGETKTCGKCTFPVVATTETGKPIHKVPPLDTELPLLGLQFNKLTITEVGFSAKNTRMVRTLCLCGKTSIQNRLAITTGHTTSCGCYKKNIAGNQARTHSMSTSPIYQVWNNMKQRCSNPNSTSYGNYGGRGIRVCDDWQDFDNFYKDMGDIPTGMSLDRIDVNGDYCKSNCRWATDSQQAYNKRMYPNNTSGRTGVSWNVNLEKWQVSISINKLSIHLGFYYDIESAVKARELAEIKYYGINKE